MGQAKERKARLGHWYGRPIGPGHPDFVPPKKPEPIHPILRFGPFDALGMVVEVPIEQFSVCVDRIEVEMTDEARKANWPIPYQESVKGELCIGSRKFGIVALERHTKTGCVFLRSQPAREEPTHPEAVRTPSGTDEALQGHPESEGRPVRMAIGTHPKARRFPGLLALAMLGTIAAFGIDLGPEPRPKKR